MFLNKIFTMKLFSAVTLCFFYAGISAQNTYIPDDSFEQYLIWMELDDVLNDSVLTENIVDVQALFLSYSSINDLTGLEGFSSLDTLSLSELQNSEISYLDMSVVPGLKYLDCYNQNGQIDSINLSQNLDLQFLDASGNTLTQLDLSNNPALEHLRINFNQLSEIDLSNNSFLKDIWINNNNLISLDLGNNNMLENLGVNLNQLSEIDLSNKPNLINVYCEENNILVLDINNAPFLSSLRCSGNQISELDVLNKPNLEQLFAGNNLLSSLDLSSCGSLVWIWLNSNQLFELNVANGLNTYMGPSPGGGLYHIPDFTDNPNLTCITVDDVAHCTEWWNTEGYPIFGNPNGYVAIDSTMYFSSDCTSVSVDELSSESVLIYPNPATNHITVDLNGLEEPNGVLKIYDLSGRLGLEKLANSVATIDVSYLVKGVYTFEVSTSDKVVRKNVVIE